MFFCDFQLDDTNSPPPPVQHAGNELTTHPLKRCPSGRHRHLGTTRLARQVTGHVVLVCGLSRRSRHDTLSSWAMLCWPGMVSRRAKVGPFSPSIKMVAARHRFLRRCHRRSRRLCHYHRHGSRRRIGLCHARHCTVRTRTSPTARPRSRPKHGVLG